MTAEFTCKGKIPSHHEYVRIKLGECLVSCHDSAIHKIAMCRGPLDFCCRFYFFLPLGLFANVGFYVLAKQKTLFLYHRLKSTPWLPPLPLKIHREVAL